MTFKRYWPGCVIAAVVGFCVGIVVQIILQFGEHEPVRFLKTGLAVGFVIVFAGCKAGYEFFWLRDYDKQVKARRERMHW